MTENDLSIRAAISAWERTRGNSDESMLGAAMRRAAERASDEKHPDTTELFRGWTHLVTISDQVSRGTALALWDEVDAVISSREWEQAEAVQRVIYQTLISVWSSLADKSRENVANRDAYPNRGIWTRTVEWELLRANRRNDENEAAFSSLCALLDLAIEVHRSNESPGSTTAEWVEAACRDANEVKKRSRCREASPCGFPGSPKEQGTTDAAKIALALRAAAVRCEDVLNRRPTIEEIGEEIVRIGSSHSAVCRDDVTRMLRYHAFESRLAEKLLAKYAIEIEVPSATPHAPIYSVDRLEQSILLLGPPGVGKTSFFFASEALCGSARQPVELDGPYPPIAIERLPNPENVEDREHSIDLQRGDWSNGIKSQDESIRTAARAGPKGLGSYWMLDTIGELIRQENENVFAALIKRLHHPGVLALMVDAQGHEDKEIKGRVTQTARSVLDLQKRPGLLQMPAVYLIVNKLDDRLTPNKRSGEYSDNDAIAEIIEETNKRVFDLAAYLKIEDDDGAALSLREWTARILGWVRADAGLTRHVGVRELVIENVERWSELLRAVADTGVTELYLTFTSSLPDQTGTEVRAIPSVEAFWRHIWGPRQERSATALAFRARTIFCEWAKSNAMAALDLAKDEAGLRIPVRMQTSTIEATETGIIRRDGGELRKRIRQGAMQGGKGLDRALASLSNEHRELSDWRNSIIGHIRSLHRDWEKLLPRVVMELNLDPAWPCADLGADQVSEYEDVNTKLREWLARRRKLDVEENLTGGKAKSSDGSVYCAAAQALAGLVSADRDGELDAQVMDLLRKLQTRLELQGEEANDKADDESWADRHRLKESDVDGYYGALRAGSLLADAWPLPEQAPELEEWLAKDAGLSVGKRIEGEIRKAGTHGLSPQIRAVLWQLADHGSYSDSSKERLPDYGLFAPTRWWGTERLLLRTLTEEKSVAGSRIRRAIEIMNSLSQIAALGLDENETLETRVREELRRFLIISTFRAMGLKRNAWEDNREELKEKIRDIQKKIHARKPWSIKEWLSPKGYGQSILAQGEESLRSFWEGEITANLTEKGIGSYTKADQQLAFINACLLELDAMGRAPPPETENDVAENVRNIWRPVEQRCREHNNRVELYAAETAISFLVVYARWLSASLRLTEEEHKDLDRVVFQKRRETFDPSLDLGPTEADSRFDNSDVENAIAVFERIIATRAGRAIE